MLLLLFHATALSSSNGTMGRLPTGLRFDNASQLAQWRRDNIELRKNSQLSSPTSDASCASDWTHKMPSCYQICSEWCWATTVTMAIGYYKGESACEGTECQVVSREYGACCPWSRSCNNSPFDPGSACNKGGLPENEIDALDYFTGGTFSGYGPLSQASLDAALNSGRVVVIGVAWEGSQSGHSLIIGGCGGGYYYLHDPWGWYPQDPGTPEPPAWQGLTYGQLLQYVPARGHVGDWSVTVMWSMDDAEDEEAHAAALERAKLRRGHTKTGAAPLVRPQVTVDRASGTYRDGANRTRIFHGLNFVTKQAPYYPTIGKKELDALDEMGMNVVRLGVMLGGLYPTSLVANETYLEQIRLIIKRLWARNISTIVDLHQDILSPVLCGEGAPSWMVNVSTLGSLPFPEPMTLNASQTAHADPATGAWTRPMSELCNDQTALKALGWSAFYATDAVGKAFGQVYAGGGKTMLSQAFEAYWQAVPKALAGEPGVLAYELLNEPWVGDEWAHPELALEAGAAETRQVGPYMERMHALVRQADPSTPVLYAPAELNNRLARPVGYNEGFLGGEPMAFHICACARPAHGDLPTTYNLYLCLCLYPELTATPLPHATSADSLLATLLVQTV
jgi:hypothetical protein